jgi:hypothetical protein
MTCASRAGGCGTAASLATAQQAWAHLPAALCGQRRCLAAQQKARGKRGQVSHEVDHRTNLKVIGAD